MANVALLSNPNSTGNRAILPEVRSYCVKNSDVFHYEVDHVDEIAKALETIARVKPKVLVINGGDGTVQAALTELYQGGHFGDNPPPVAVLPNGKTNLIALDLGSEGNPLKALERIVELAKHDLHEHLVSRELIALSDGGKDSKVVLGMFLGGAGLSEFILYCRHKIYPLGLPNAAAHVLTVFAALASVLFGIKGKFLPKRSTPIKISLIRDGQFQGNFAVLIVTTLERLLLMKRSMRNQNAIGRMQFLAIDQRAGAIVRFLLSVIFGRLGKNVQKGIHLERGDMIRIEGEGSNVLMDGELFSAQPGQPIVLKSTKAVSFLRLAA
ncbi:MAG: acylglycerol kinase family protein [Sphingomonadales bacterium]|nr:acylglycerol kinase family protein [Sphingomonadales bacterium]PIX65148.1 MAG: diacylglycerol kinase [Sphingomonadales bacterium CG_4_10_14_3_um_filter_58_15]NCO49027.1 acylglycerol kinase family protein [Sphingomonadales bacterium]NCP00838.1 acylglycerol kinase family protein [Sphingomonadales bacterium]NCP26202.1 acylglycerol kinase family protein [Sphingomonadales bacterium]